MIAPSTIVGGRYRVVKALGGGGMKLVYLAEDLRLAGRSCALAEMVDSFTSPDLQHQAVAAFQREADMLAQLANEHIPRIFDRFSEANHHYLVMEYIDGTTLEEELRAQGGKLPAARVIDIALQILSTLEYLHNLDPPVIYRDLKPSNVMVTNTGMAKLIDFGIARHFAPLSNATMIGTQGYAPPEQYRGRVELRSDLYALGATMHHALSGRDPASEPPFSFPPLRKLCPGIDPSLAALVDQALAYDVVNRTRDASEFRQRLIEIRDGGSDAGKAAAPASSSRSAARPQLPLPLGGTAQAPGAAGSAAEAGIASAAGVPRPGNPVQRPAISPQSPTVLSSGADLRCPSCARMIPIDSRYCSFCAADLRHADEPFRLGGDPAAETIVLGSGGRNRTAGNGRAGTMPGGGAARRHRGIRRPLLILAAIFAISFIVRMLLINETAPATPAGDESGSIAPPAASGSTADGDRAARLRDALDNAGYRDVRFRLNGNEVVVWGTVRDDFDLANVQLLIFQNTGIAMINAAELRTRNADALGAP